MNIFKGVEHRYLKKIDEDIEYLGLEYDSRKIEKDFIFVALEGSVVDGHDYIDKAVEKGAKCIIVSKEVETKHEANYVLVENLRQKLSEIASNFYDHPQNKIQIIGITGTNGKTTCSYMIEQFLGSENVARIGTIEYKIGDEIISAPNTTPESSELIKLIHKAVKKGLKYLVMEVSSHSLELGRVKTIDFDYAMFTNLTPDHLDYHKNMDNYFAAKKKLFYKLKDKKNAVINIDDSYGEKIYEEFKTYGALSYGMKQGALRVEHIQNTKAFSLSYMNKTYEIHPLVLGDFNIYNILGSMGIALKIGLNIDELIQKVVSIHAAPGRLEPVNAGQDYQILVDYAHTPDALENVLKTVNNIKHNKIITVFGCGGDRDKTKRPIMASIAEKYSDLVVVTSDNPRTEDPQQILKEVVSGLKLDNHIIEIDRKIAIGLAIFKAEKDDIVLIAGKGHENYQILGLEKIHFDDREIARDFTLQYINKKNDK